MERVLEVEKMGSRYILGFYVDDGSDEPRFMECEFVEKGYIPTHQDKLNYL